MGYEEGADDVLGITPSKTSQCSGRKTISSEEAAIRRPDGHTLICGYHLDQYYWECNCGFWSAPTGGGC